MTTSMTNKPPPLTNIVNSNQFDKAAYTAYEKVKSERDALKESEKVYKRRNEALETEKNDLLQSYQNLYDENKILRSKVEHGPDAQRIRGFREEIKRLQDKTETLRSQTALLEDERGDLIKKLNIVTAEKKRLEDGFKMERSLHMDKRTDLEKENVVLTEKVEKLEKQNNEYEYRTQRCQDETEGMADRYKHIKVENMKLETKFKKQKDEMDEELRETKTTNNEMAKEIIQLKMKQSKLESELHSTKIDYEASQKQIEYQRKEFEIFKVEASRLRRDVKNKNRDYYRLEDELKSAESMIDAAQNYGFDAVMQERKSLRKKENAHMKRIEDLELQVEALSQSNAMLEKESNDYRMKVDALVIENHTMQYSENGLKRRIQILEEANVDLDQRGQYLMKRKPGLHVTMGNQNVKNVEKEKQSLIVQVNYLEEENRRMEKVINRLTNKPYKKAFEDVSIYTTRTRGSTHKIHADLTSNYKSSQPPVYSSKTSRSKQSQSLPDIY